MGFKLFDYDDENLQSILNYAKHLESMTFRDIANIFKKSNQKFYINPKSNNNISNLMVFEDRVNYITNTNAKGQLGNILERMYFGYIPNSNQSPDFEKVGLELKQTCIDLTQKGAYRAGERLSITNISYTEPVHEDFYSSHLYSKINLILLIHYLRNHAINRLDYQIKFVNLFKIPSEDLEIIKQDYQKIINKIKAGKAHELSEGDTLYLGACTKGSTAAKSMQKQFYNDSVKAKRRNFCLKQKYMNYILQKYILKNDNCLFQSIVSNNEILKKQSFEEYVLEKINKNIGKSDAELCKHYNREYNNNESQWIHLAFLMLGIKGNHAEEFEKANIVVKSIRIEANGKMKENISLPPFKFKTLINEDWENSFLFNYFESTKFLFVIYKFDKTHYKLLGAKFWNMPHDDFDIVKKGWQKIKDSIIEGVTFTPQKYGTKVRYLNSLPKSKDNPIIHIRPHAAKSAFKFKDGTIIGDLSNANELPDGQWMTTQSFWINNTYILSQIADCIK